MDFDDFVAAFFDFALGADFFVPIDFSALGSGFFFVEADFMPPADFVFGAEVFFAELEFLEVVCFAADFFVVGADFFSAETDFVFARLAFPFALLLELSETRGVNLGFETFFFGAFSAFGVAADFFVTTFCAVFFSSLFFTTDFFSPSFSTLPRLIFRVVVISSGLFKIVIFEMRA